MTRRARFIPFRYSASPSSNIERCCPKCGGHQPPWRTGPNGRMLCNSCGLQYQRKRKKKKKKTNSTHSLEHVHGVDLQLTSALCTQAQNQNHTDIVQLHDTSATASPIIHSLEHANVAYSPDSQSTMTLGTQAQGTDHHDQLDHVIGHRAQRQPTISFQENQTSSYDSVQSHATTYPGMAYSTGEQPATMESTHLWYTTPNSCQLQAFAPDLSLLVEFQPCHSFGPFFHWFRSRTERLHLEALQRNSSMYAAIERFHVDIQGDIMEYTTYAVLREEYYRQSSPASRGLIISASAAENDLDFGMVIGDWATEIAPRNDYLHHQRIVERLDSERIKRAIWDLSRLPPGPHLEDSQTYVWAQRSLFSMNTCSGERVAMDIQSGCEKYQFRKFHRVLALPGSNKGVYTTELYGAYEPKIRDACIETCQAWFVGVLDESAKFQDENEQLAVINANKEYMFESTKAYTDALIKIGVERPLHICSVDCVAHFQPQFHSILEETNHALQELFSTPEVIQSYIRGQLKYPTQYHLHLSRILGQAQSHLHFTDMILPDEKREQHLQQYRPALGEARMKLENACRSPLKWNYLPPEVENRASAKVELAKEANKLSPIALVF